MRALAVFAVLASACGDVSPPTGFDHHTLAPYPILYGPGDPMWTPQPHRDRPARVAVTPDGARALVTLQGQEDEPGHEVALVDLAARRVLARIAVGSSPTGVAVHPGGRFAVVTNRFSNWASVVDLAAQRVVLDVPTDYYAIDVAFTPDGRRAYLSNRWKDQVVRWDVTATADRFVVTDARAAALPTSTHPRDVAVSADGARLAVAGLDGMHVTLFELPSEHVVADVNLRAPANDVVFAGSWLLALTQGAGDGHPPLVGPDGDDDGRPGDSTANVNFQDQQNEIAVLRASDGAVQRRYTTDTTCCRDYRDVSPDDPVLGSFLPPRDQWIVGGAVPEAGAVCPGDTAGTSRLWVAYQASSEVEAFDIDLAQGTLRPVSPRSSVGFAPGAAACVGTAVTVVAALAETLETVRTPGAAAESIVVGDVTGGRFPATDAEIGEALNVATAPFTVDGDQSCVMCHREFGDVEKPFSMPLLRYPEGTRMTMQHRGLADTRPWFFETAMDENNFFPVLNEFARVENFCCTDPSLWSAANPVPDDCETSPPPVCATRAWPRNLPTRNAFYMAQAQRVFGRTRTIGDAFDAPLNFQGLTRALGLSLLMRSRLLPNPNPRDTASVRRGEGLFFSQDTACANCHPAPGYALSSNASVTLAPRFLPVITPVRAADGRNADLVSDGFQSTFPETHQDTRMIQFGVTSLRNEWAHARRYLHDGRARSLREVIVPPGHASLRPGEHGFNEVDGIPNTHGATSQLSPSQVDDLVNFMMSL